MELGRRVEKPVPPGLAGHAMESWSAEQDTVMMGALPTAEKRKDSPSRGTPIPVGAVRLVVELNLERRRIGHDTTLSRHRMIDGIWTPLAFRVSTIQNRWHDNGAVGSLVRDSLIPQTVTAPAFLTAGFGQGKYVAKDGARNPVSALR